MQINILSSSTAPIRGSIYVETHDERIMIVELDPDFSGGELDITTHLAEDGIMASDIASVRLAPLSSHWESIAHHQQPDLHCKPIENCTATTIRNALGWERRPSLGEDIRIGLIDRGFRRSPDLKNLAVYNLDGTTPLPTDDAYDTPDLYHGTMVAGVIGSQNSGAERQGFAPNCELTGVILPWCGDEDTGLFDAAALPLAIAYLIDKHDVQLINISGGFVPEKYEWTDVELDELEGLNEQLESVVQSATAKGVAIVAAAGNNPNYPVAIPARMDEVVGVSGVAVCGIAPEGTIYRDCELEARESGSAGRCPDGVEFFVDPHAAIGPEVDVFSISRFVSSVDASDLFEYIGTSFAAPAVTGILAAQLSSSEVYRTLNGPEKAGFARELALKLGENVNIGDFPREVPVVKFNRV